MSQGDIEMLLESMPFNVPKESEESQSSSNYPTPEMLSALHPIAILMDELKHVEMSIRLNAIQKLDTIALALGPERTRTELMPFLKDSLMQDEDELLFTLALELSKFVDLVGGPEFAHFLLLPLESLCDIEEPLVRQQAIESLIKLINIFSDEQCEKHLWPMLQRMSTAAWFTSRMSAARLFPILYSRYVSESVLNAFLMLLHDDTPMVRRVAASSLSEIIPYIKDESILFQDVIPSFIQLTKDDQDAVRLLSLDVLLALAEHPANNSPNSSIEKHILPVVKDLFEDSSWRVHYVLAEKFPLLVEAIYPTSKSTDPVKSDKPAEESDTPNSSRTSDLIPDNIKDREALLDKFVLLLNDHEGEVRTMSCRSLPKVCSLFPVSSIVSLVLPCLDELLKDSSDFVRSALALHLSDMSEPLGKDLTIQYLLPVLIALLRDSHSDVRLNVISKLETMSKVIGISLLSNSLLPAVIELANDSQWRIRMAIVEYMPLLTLQLGQEFFESSLQSLCLAFLSDTVYAVRMAAVAACGRIIQQYGLPWAKSKFLQLLTSQSTNPNYLYRMIVLFCMDHFSDFVDVEIVQNSFLPVWLTLSKDKIPNVRLNVAKSAPALVAPLFKETPDAVSAFVDANLKPVLESLLNDTDEDVIDFSKQAIDKLDDLVSKSSQPK